MNNNNKGRVGISHSQIMSSEMEIKIIGGRAVVIRSNKVGNQVVKKTENQIAIQTEEQQEVSKMASSGIEESQRYNLFCIVSATFFHVSFLFFRLLAQQCDIIIFFVFVCKKKYIYNTTTIKKINKLNIRQNL